MRQNDEATGFLEQESLKILTFAFSFFSKRRGHRPFGVAEAFSHCFQISPGFLGFHFVFLCVASFSPFFCFSLFSWFHLCFLPGVWQGFIHLSIYAPAECESKLHRFFLH